MKKNHRRPASSFYLWVKICGQLSPLLPWLAPREILICLQRNVNASTEPHRLSIHPLSYFETWQKKSKWLSAQRTDCSCCARSCHMLILRQTSHQSPVTIDTPSPNTTVCTRMYSSFVSVLGWYESTTNELAWMIFRTVVPTSTQRFVFGKSR